MNAEPAYEDADHRRDTARRAADYRGRRAALETHVLAVVGRLLVAGRLHELPNDRRISVWVHMGDGIFPADTFDRFGVWEILNRPLPLVRRASIET